MAAVLLLLVAAFAHRRYKQHVLDRQVWARTGGTRPPKYGPSFDYCEVELETNVHTKVCNHEEGPY